MIKRDRLKVYERMLEELSSRPKLNSFCFLLSYPHIRGKSSSNIEDYKELHSLKPATLCTLGFWFPTGAKGLQPRIDLLKKAIQLCKQQTL